MCAHEQALAHMRAANTCSEWEAQAPTTGDVCVFQVAGVISAGVVMIAIVALGKLLEPLQKVQPCFLPH